ncbi:MAG: DUF6482 family protein [Oleiphilaceae bacterium]|nr:DUF6482 family protein [Oleiphilaceae bacterium]
MKIRFSELAKLPRIDKVIIHSLDQALYCIAIEHEGDSLHLVEDDGTLFKRHNLMLIRELLSPLHIELLVLRQQSAYDEMVGQPLREQDNTMEIVLGRELYPPLRTLN